TIVELVIVIAVIAILASVLIPTIAGLVRDANISADTVLAKELNRVLAEEDAKDDTSNADFDAVLATLRGRGYYIANLNTRADECYFVWDQGSKQILLVDGREDYKVLYSHKEVSEKSYWYFAISDSVLAATVIADGFPSANVKQPTNSASELKEVVMNATGEGEFTVLINENFNVNEGEFLEFSNEKADIVLDLCGNTISANLIDGSLFDVTAGKLTLTGGTIQASSSDVANDNGDLIWASGNSNVEIKGMTISFDSTTVSNNLAVGAGTGAEMTITDTTIVGANGTNAFQCYGADITLNNVTIKQSGDALSSWYASAIQLVNVIKNHDPKIEYNGKEYAWQTVDQSNLVVNGGTYIGEKAIQISAPGGDLLIKGGTFTGNDYVLQNDFAPGNYADGDKFTSNVTIEGGTFNGNIKLSDKAAEAFVIKGGTFNGDTIKIGSAAEVTLSWENLQQFVVDGATVIINGNSYTKA
ncbi:MAG: type II secretion system protein, partial [Clostridia bacterium]|nr:type II secretion system protein [Clostridia bacterium]